MIKIYVDADACPVKNEVERVATRHNLKTYMVCDGGIRPSLNPLIQLVVVNQGADAADDWIAYLHVSCDPMLCVLRSRYVAVPLYLG